MFCNQTTSFLSQAAPNRHTFSRIGWGAAAIALLAGTVLQVQDHGGGWLALGFALMPDLGLIAGIDRGLAKGQLAPRAVPIYNALHRFIGPALVAALALSGVIPAVWLAAALGWALHISIDRAVGYGLRGNDGFQRS
ncbi:MAG: DUF4260 family protein [Thermomicrobiales bacterium]|nr:DUF4260 family protein [Thermomicrobiales bacterium]MCO5220293.1 DUF4260 domain-containing protein [Thermomicrobiales bacterium]